MSILLHAVFLFALTPSFKLGRFAGVYAVEESYIDKKMKPIEVDIIEGLPEVARPLFGRDFVTARSRRPMEASRRVGPPSPRSDLALGASGPPSSAPLFTALKEVDPEGILSSEGLSSFSLSEPVPTPREGRDEAEGDERRRGGGGGDVDSQMADRLSRIAAWIGRHARARAVDIAFILDTSGSMEDNIVAVGNHLNDMIGSLEASGLDARVAVVKFRYLKRDMLVFPFTRDVDRYRRLLRNVRCYGDERAYDAIWKALDQLRFRPGAERHFILVTDEPMKGSVPFLKVVSRCRRERVAVTVIGIDDPYHKMLAKLTGGVFMEIPR